VDAPEYGVELIRRRGVFLASKAPYHAEPLLKRLIRGGIETHPSVADKAGDAGMQGCSTPLSESKKLFVRTVGMARATVKIGAVNLTYAFSRLVWLEGKFTPARAEPGPKRHPARISQ
jgi:hypothetical protein